VSEAIGVLTTVLLTFDVLVVGLGNVGELDRQTLRVGLLGRLVQASGDRQQRQ
jgi:hypothetical protein